MTKRKRFSAPRPRARNRNVAGSPVTQRRRYRLSLGGNTRSQKTLTQINFVNQPSMRESLSDLDLEYIEDEESRQDATPPKTRSRRRKAESSVRNDRLIQPANTTLTQMGYGTIQSDSDEDDCLTLPTERTVPAQTRKRNSRILEPAEGESPLHNISEVETNGFVRPRKRRISCEKEHRVKRLDDKHRTDSDSFVLKSSDKPHGSSKPKKISKHVPSPARNITKASDQNKARLFSSPITPQKVRPRVVPSSQSPESPELVLRSASHKVATTRSSLKSQSDDIPYDHITNVRINGSPSPFGATVNTDFTQAAFSLPPPIDQVLESPSLHTINGRSIRDRCPSSPLSSVCSPEAPSKSFLGEIQPTLTLGRPVSRSSAQSKGSTRQIVYETDGETDSQSERIFVPTSQLAPHDNIPSGPIVHGSSPQSPSPKPQGESTEAVPSISDPDASLLYSRHYLTYPYEKYMGTPRRGDMGEIFEGHFESPSDSIEPSLPVPPHLNNRTSIPKELNLTEDLSTESVPESSQVQQHDAEIQNTQPRTSPAPIVLIESSQEPTTGTNNTGPQSDPRGILTTSQLVPENLMDSIPPPPGWMPSQVIDQEDI
ncbi:predicted protein [Uncinocarpus reesii 1704]|uniref:Uncharacterized protein n=1 Tax=Uncinocarpus reesii (strain UAMH 1704) TaxID=336963 RepID=C4JHD6_UNCRE|nr:uncharacterized protein UREG_01299 [Uncinocarpus reesii 1704]EEP76450.1 predicted protein [Uncinocarpus reesii 1704]